VARLGDRNTIFVVPNAVREWPEVPPHETREHLTCVVISRLTKVKRVEHAVRAFQLVLERVPQSRLEIHGFGESTGSLRSLIKELGLQANVEMVAYSPDARRRFTQVAVSLLTSIHEGQPMCVLESLASGCPVIAYDIKYGPADMIDDGEQGFLVPEGDLHQFADRIIRVLTDRALAERLSVSARQRAENVYGDEVQARRWSQVFHAVARTLDALGDHSRELYLFDTFEGCRPRDLPPCRRCRRVSSRCRTRPNGCTAWWGRWRTRCRRRHPRRSPCCG
jgi:glycosyltransferase involved in cell wall biosynthesis